MFDKSKIPLWLLVIILVLSTSPGSEMKAEEKFKFGTWTYNHWAGKSQQIQEVLLSRLGDSLRFNYLVDVSWDSLRVGIMAEKNIRIAADNFGEDYVAPSPTFYSYAHYHPWEAEGNEGYSDSLRLKHGDHGQAVQDGDIVAWKVTAGEDTPGLIQWGPDYGQDLKFFGTADEPWINYSVSYRIRTGSDPDTLFEDTLAILYVTKPYRDEDNNYCLDTCAVDTLWDSDFADTVNYIESTITYRTQRFCDMLGICGRKTYGIEFKIHWFGRRDFYVDKVTLYDDLGYYLIQGEYDSNILTHINTYFNDSSVVDAWYMNEELGTLHDIDAFAPWRDVDSVLNSVNPQKRAFAALHYDTLDTRYIMDLLEPKELHVDRYPLGGEIEDLQTAWNSFTSRLDNWKRLSLEKEVDFSITVQAFSAYVCTASDRSVCPDSLGKWVWAARMPTTQELRCETNLSLAYGAKGVLYFKYADGRYTVVIEGDTIRWKTVNGLTDTSGHPTENWYYIRDVVGPFMEQMGETFYNLQWQGAGLCDTVSLIPNSFIDSVKSNEYAPDSIYAEVGFFKDDADTDYFMLVNRRCLPTEEQNVTVYIDSIEMGIEKKMWYVIDQYSKDTTFTGAINGAIPFTTHLDPGEGKLFKLVP
jgi:hypothetical protein